MSEQIIAIGPRRYRVGRFADLRVGDRIMIGYIARWEIHHRIFSPTEMKNGKMRREWQPAFGTILSMKKHEKWGGFRIAEITGIPGDVLIRPQGRCLHEWNFSMNEIDEEVAS